MHKQEKRPYTVVTLLLLSALLGTLAHTAVPKIQAADVLIDTFAYESTSASYTITDPLPTFPVTTLAASATGVTDVLGGQREICLVVTGGNANSTAAFRSDATNDYLDMTLGTSVKAQPVAQWDGQTNTDCTLDPTGLGGVDLTDSGTNAGILLRVVGSDGLPVNITVRIFTDANNWAHQIIRFRSNVQSPSEAVDIFLPFDTFYDQSGTLDVTDVGAVELELDASSDESAGADMTIKLFKATSVYEYGDLPSGYGGSVLNARHIPQGMRLGDSVDAEAGNYASALADGDDDTDFDDEDGVTRRNRSGTLPTGDPNWAPDSSGDDGKVQIIARNCSEQAPCYAVGWIDWEQDNDLDGPGEQVLEQYLFSDTDGSNYGFEIPSGTSFTDIRYYARFRICPAIWDDVAEDWGPGACASPTATNVRDGEVEDYTWDWGNPTAVKLTSFTATPAGGAILVAWETASEQDNAGFHLYRSATAESPGERLNQYLIPSESPGGEQGAAYEFLDSTAQPGMTYYYTLEDVDLSGVRTPHGPAVVTTPYTVFLPLVQR